MWEGARPSHEALGSMHHAHPPKKVVVPGERIYIPSGGELCNTGLLTYPFRSRDNPKKHSSNHRKPKNQDKHRPSALIQSQTHRLHLRWYEQKEKVPRGPTMGSEIVLCHREGEFREEGEIVPRSKVRPPRNLVRHSPLSLMLTSTQQSICSAPL